MSTDSHRQPLLLACILVSGLVVRLVLAGQFLLVPDEANYWQWSRYLALGYHDHPPMIAWLIRLSAMVLGETEFAVRLPTIVGGTLAALYLCLLARHWFGPGCALSLALLSQLLLLFNGASLITTPDGLLLPCWAAACYHAALACERGKPGQWLATGCWFGLGMLSKYTMLLFLPGLFLYMLSSKTARGQLATRWPWFGLLCSIFLFTPVLLWNADNEWATFRHVLYQGGMGKQALFSLRFIGDFLLSQILLLSPIVAFFLFRAWWLVCTGAQGDEHSRLAFLTWMSLLPFTVFLLLSFHVRIYGNWPMPAYLMGLLLAAGIQSQRPRLPRWWRAGFWTALAMTLPILVQLLYPVLPLPISLDRVARETCGWRQLGQRVELARTAMPAPERTFVFGLRYQWASLLAFYMPGQPETVSINRWTRPNVYDFWFDDAMLIGQDGIGIYEWPGMADQLATLFTESEPVEQITISRRSPWFGEQTVQHFYLFRGHGFKGGLRWVPSDQDDIRATSRQSAPVP